MYHFTQLTKDIHSFLQRQSTAVGEYEVIQVLDASGAFVPAQALSASLQLYHKHFVTMHCLYRLQQALYPQRLDVSPLFILLHPAAAASYADFSVASEEGGLRSYYLDLAHLTEATEDSVAHLLKQFWQRFDAHSRSDEAFAALGLTPSASWDEVRQAYRQQVQQAHPDKGGSAEAFAQAHNAYQALKRRFQ